MSSRILQQTIADYFKTQPVVRAWFFGSFARGEETPLSDVDLMVQFDEKALLDHSVDLVLEKSMRPTSSGSANQDKTLIYGK